MKRALLLSLLLLAGRLGISQTPDPAKIPHYFGPYPNWANSPLTTVDANIQFTDTCGGGAGTGAAAVASVDARGAVTGVTVTSQGAGYTCAPDVAITSTYGSGASAHATFTRGAGYLSSIALVNGGSNYFAPVVTITGNGTGAAADATLDPYTGTITGITITNAGTGYTSATISISDSGGTGTGAMATASVSTATIAVVVNATGTGYRTPGGLRKFVDTLPGSVLKPPTTWASTFPSPTPTQPPIREPTTTKSRWSNTHGNCTPTFRPLSCAVICNLTTAQTRAETTP